MSSLTRDAMLDWVKEREGGFHPRLYPSPEGGLDTIGFGHKFRNAAEQDEWRGRAMELKEGERLLRQDWQRAEQLSQRHLSQRHLDWDSLTPERQFMLTDFAFNGGPALLHKFPNFVRAVYKGDMAKAQRECHRHYKDKTGQVHELKDRNHHFQLRFFTGPPIPCPSHPATARPSQHSHSQPAAPAHAPRAGPHHSDPARHSPSHHPPPNSLSRAPAAPVATPHVSSGVDAVVDADDDDLPDFIADEFDGLDRRIEAASNLSNMSLLDAASQQSASYHLVDPAALRFGDSSTAVVGQQPAAAAVLPVFDLAAQGEAALRSVGANMVHDAANLIFGTDAAKPTLNQLTAHLVRTSTVIVAQSLMHNQLNDLIFGGSASHFEVALLDTAASVGLMLAYGNAEAARKVAFEAALNYAVHELVAPASYGHSKTSVGGSLFQSDNRILSGTIDQHSANYSPVFGVSVGAHFRTTHMLRQEGDYLVDRHTNQLGGHVNGLGVGNVSFGFGSRRDASSVLQRTEGAQTVSTWFTRHDEGKFMADVRLADRVSDLEDLSLGQTLLLLAHNPLMGPLALLSRLPALSSYKQTYSVRANTDGSPLSVTGNLPLSAEAQQYRPAGLLAPLSSDGVPALLEQASAMHRMLQHGLAQEARSRVGRVETVDSTFHEHGEGSNLGGVMGGSESDRYYNRGRVLETTASDRTVVVDGETVTDVMSRTNVFSFSDLTYYYSYTKNSFFGMSRHKHEERFEHGQKRVQNELKQTVEQHVRLRSKADGTAFSSSTVNRQLEDGSQWTRSEHKLVKEESARVSTTHGVSSSREESLTEHGDFEQSITSSSTRAVVDTTDREVHTDTLDHRSGRFSDTVSRDGQQLAQPERTEHVDAHVVSQWATLRHVDHSQPLHSAGIGVRQAANVRDDGTATIYQQTTQSDDYKVGHSTLQCSEKTTAVGTLTVTAQRLSTPALVTQRAQQFGGVQSLQQDSLTEHVHSAYSSVLATSSVALDGTRTSATFALGTVEETISPLQRQVIATRTHVATAAAGSKAPPPLYVDKMKLDSADKLVAAGLKSEHHVIDRVDEIHTATYNLRSGGAAAAAAEGVADNSNSQPTSGESASSTLVKQPVDAQTLSAALSSIVPADVLRGLAEAKEGEPDVSHVRRATGISVKSQMTHADYDPRNNVLIEAHSTVRSSIVKQSELLSGSGGSAKFVEEKTLHHAPLAVTRVQLKTEKGLLWNKVSTVSSDTAAFDAAGVEQPAVKDKVDDPHYTSSAAACGAASTAASYATGLAFRAGAGGTVDRHDMADMGAATTRSLFQSHILDGVNTAELTIQRRAALSLEPGALETGRVSGKLKAAAAAGSVIIVANTVRRVIRKSSARSRAKARAQVAERRHREDAEAQQQQQPAAGVAQDADGVVPPPAAAPPAPESDPQHWLAPIAKDVAAVAGTSALDFAPVALQVALAGTKSAFLAASGAGLAIDALRTGWSLANSSITKAQAVEQVATAVVSTAAGVGGALVLELVLGGVLGLAGLPLAVFVGIGTALVTLGVQWVLTAVIDWRRKLALQGEYKQLCGALGVSEMCTDSELARAWRDAVKRLHPDKGGSGEEFIQLNERHKRAVAVRILLGLSLEREDGLRRGERTRMPTWIRWWLHVLTNLNASLQQERAQPVPSVDALHQMLDLYHPVSDRFSEWQRQQAVYAAELDE